MLKALLAGFGVTSPAPAPALCSRRLDSFWVKTEKRRGLKIKENTYFPPALERRLAPSQQVAEELNLWKASALSAQSKLSAEI